jgi:hypothetical protein
MGSIVGKSGGYRGHGPHPVMAFAGEVEAGPP